MTPIEALQNILGIIDNCENRTSLDLFGDIRQAAEEGLADQPGLPNNPFVFEFNGFDSSRRGIDSVLKGAVLGAGGTVRLDESDIVRYRDGYDLIIRGEEGFGIVVSAVERA